VGQGGQEDGRGVQVHGTVRDKKSHLQDPLALLSCRLLFSLLLFFPPCSVFGSEKRADERPDHCQLRWKPGVEGFLSSGFLLSGTSLGVFVCTASEQTADASLRTRRKARQPGYPPRRTSEKGIRERRQRAIRRRFPARLPATTSLSTLRSHVCSRIDPTFSFRFENTTAHERLARGWLNKDIEKRGEARGKKERG
jgi:hypothetical protein